MASEQRRADLVFEGGGVKGIGLAGAFRELFDRGYAPQCVAGTSAGAITAAAVAAGYSGPELEDLVLNQMHFPEFADGHRLGMLGEGVEFLAHKGLHSGDYFLRWMRDLLEQKSVRTFGDLRDAAAIDARREYRLRVIASDISGRSMLVLPQDAPKLGIEPDALPVAEAVRMSMSIPVFFDPVVRDRHVVVDGGLLSNYPIWLFDAPAGTRPQFPTFGLLLVAPDQAAPLLPHSDAGEKPGRLSLVGYFKAIAETALEAHDRLYVEQANYARTIPIPTLGVGTTEFDIKPDRAKALFESGRKAAVDFLATWDFDAYIDQFRTGAVPARRATVSHARQP